ncbi:MAG: HAD family hydrolase [Clostridia bacterium]|nr:HAD family hydrolase [Clostridia bacterium]
MIKLCVFDLDGTLLDTVPDLTAAMNSAMDRTGHNGITTDQTRQYIGNGIKMYAKRAVSGSYETDTPDDEADIAVKYFKEYYSQHLIGGTAPYPGMKELLLRLKADGIRLAVLSNKYDAAAKHIIDHFFPGIFDCIYGESEICKRKPDISGFMLICKDTDCTPEEAVMIGDAPTDVNVAKNAGATPVSVLWGYRSREVLTENGAKLFAETADEIYNIIKAL